MKLTQEQIINLCQNNRLMSHFEIFEGSDVYESDLEHLKNFANATYALGIAAGKAVGAAEMLGRNCEIVRLFPNWIGGTAKAEIIQALKETT